MDPNNSGFKQVWRADKWRSASENNLSLGTDVADIDKYFIANRDKVRKIFTYAFHHSNRSHSWTSFGKAKYHVTLLDALLLLSSESSYIPSNE